MIQSLPAARFQVADRVVSTAACSSSPRTFPPRRQLAVRMPFDPAAPGGSALNPKLRDDISTDEITPAYICYYFDETSGLPVPRPQAGEEFPIVRGAVKAGGACAASPGSAREGSSREQSPYAEMTAGIRLVIAENIERIYRENCQNLGVFTSTNFSLIERVRRGEEIPLEEFTRGEGDISKGIIEYGGLFNYNVARLQGKRSCRPCRQSRDR